MALPEPEQRGDLRRGVENMLIGCAGVGPGAALLILEEDPALGHFGPGLAAAVAGVAAELGLAVTRRDIGFNPAAAEPPAAVLAEMAQADHILYLARLGDQMRFRPLPGQEKSVVSYATTITALASPFGTAPHQGFVALKTAINTAMREAAEIRVQCPLGSDFRGRLTDAAKMQGDVGIRRFPMCVAAPVSMAGFSGRVALARFLVGTGSIYYAPFLHPIDGIVTARFSGTQVLDYHGAPAAVAGVRAHVARIADAFGIDGGYVHSWHAGIHPGCAYAGRAEDAPAHWSGSAFGNPRLLHVHTCGDYAPGEICWNLLDPTVTLDGVALWQAGRLYPERIAGGAEVLARHPGIAALFAAPETAVGIGPVPGETQEEN